MIRPPSAAVFRQAVLVSILFLSVSGLARQTQLPGSEDPRLTATLSGTLMSFRTGQRLEGLRLALTTVGNIAVYETTTGAEGRFLFSKIRPGQYFVVVVRDGYRFQVGRVALRGGESLERAFSKGVELSGSVTDERGAAVQAVTVCALRQDDVGPMRYTPVMWSRTDARGRFVLGPGADAPPGTYIAAVMPSGCDTAVIPDLPEHLARYPATYAPGVASVADARAIEIEGTSAPFVAIALRPGTTTRLEGRLVGYINTTIVPGQIILEPPDGPVSIVRTARISSDGRFTFTGLMPGSYRLTVTPKRGPDPLRWTVQTVAIAGEPERRVVLPLHSTMALAGRIDFAGHLSMLYKTPVFLTVNAEPVYERGSVALLLPTMWVSVGPDGVFGITGLMPGAYRLSVSGTQPYGWHPRSALYSGRPGDGERLAPVDLFDVPITIEQGKSIFGVVVNMTYLTTTTAGLIEDGENRPVPGAAAVVFSSDARYWRLRSRRVQVAFAGKDGRFAITGLPEGDYLIAASRSAPRTPGPEFLESLRASAAAFSLADGESKALVLRLPGKAPFDRRPGLNN